MLSPLLTSACGSYSFRTGRGLLMVIRNFLRGGDGSPAWSCFREGEVGDADTSADCFIMILIVEVVRCHERTMVQSNLLFSFYHIEWAFFLCLPQVLRSCTLMSIEEAVYRQIEQLESFFLP